MSIKTKFMTIDPQQNSFEVLIRDIKNGEAVGMTSGKLDTIKEVRKMQKLHQVPNKHTAIDITHKTAAGLFSCKKNGWVAITGQPGNEFNCVTINEGIQGLNYPVEIIDQALPSFLGFPEETDLVALDCERGLLALAFIKKGVGLKQSVVVDFDMNDEV